MIMDVTVIYKGVELKLEGDYIQADSGGREEESVSDYFETCAVYADDVDITELMSEDQLAELDIQAIDKLY